MTVMSDDAPSRMIRVPTPLVDTVRELSRLHRQGRTKAVIERSQKIITAIDSETVIDIDSVSDTLSKVTEWQGKMELDMAAIALTIQDLITRVTELEEVRDINSDNASISKVEASFDSHSDIEMTADLEDIGSDSAPVTEVREPDDIRVDSAWTSKVEAPFDSHSDIEMTADLEDIGSDSAIVTEVREPDDIRVDNASISELESPFDSRSDTEMTADLEDIGSDSAIATEAQDPHDISTDSVPIAEVTSPPHAQEPEVLSQTALGKHLIKCSEKVVARQRKKGKESFALWSRDRDPDGKAWTWEGGGGRGEPYQYIRLE
jgi:hypothetical protein